MRKFLAGSQPHYAKIRYTQPDARSALAKAIGDVFTDSACPIQDVLVLCIGTDRSTGDSLGPLVGSQLLAGNPGFRVLGCLEQPVHAANLVQTLDALQENPPGRIIAVDASLGNMDSVGLVNIGRGALQPGAGVNKRLPAVGDMYITGIVNVGGFMEYFVLQNTRLSVVIRMSELIGFGLITALGTLGMAAKNT
ncbi:MAG: spore protease YyaC [Firmicutes bacterium]|nr:spore protease YyaC [Bacillota bacterium]